MKIIHRISKNVNQSKQQELRSLGIEVGIGLETFLVEESHPSWDKIKALIPKWRAVDIVSTKFTTSELNSASQLEMNPTWHHGYPQPEEDFEYEEQCYDLTNFCKSCGIGKSQVKPLRMTREPKWGSRHILQLNWIFDELFVLPEIWEKVFKPFGIGCEKVIHHRTGKFLKTVVQLKVDETANSSLSIPNDIVTLICEKCGRKKSHPICRGKFPEFITPSFSPILKSQEYFGSGASAFRAIIISSDLFKVIKSEKLKGVSFTPLK